MSTQRADSDRGAFVRLLGRAANVSVLSLVVYACGALRHVTSANALGASKWMDAAVLALVTSGFCINVLTGGVLSAFLPGFVRLRDRVGRQCATELFHSTAIAALAATAAVCITAVLLRRFLVGLLAPRFDADQLDLTSFLLTLLIPCVMLSAYTAVLKAVLNAEGRFALAAIAPALVPASAVVSMVVLAEQTGVVSLVVGVAAGYVLELALLVFAVRALRFPVLPRAFHASAELKNIGRQILPLIVGSLVVSAAPVIDTVMATATAAGGTSLLDYANKAIQFPLGLFVAGLTTTIFPVYVSHVARMDIAGLRRLRKRTTLMVAGICVPAATLIVVLSHPILKVLFERGAFTPEDTAATSAIFSMYALQLPFYALGMLCVRLLSALNANQVILYAGTLSTLSNVTLNYLLMPRFGLPGIALSTSVSTVVTFLFLEVMTRRRLRDHGSQVPPSSGAEHVG